MSPTKKIITIFGATGSQGGSVANIFLHDTKLDAEWTVRAVTRDIQKEKAKTLAANGAEVVSADLNDKSSLLAAIKGSTAVFAVTNYWEKLDKSLEVQQGKNLVDAAKEAGVEHFIWSSLLDINKLSGGKLPHVYHFDGKAEVEEYARSVGLPSTFFLAGCYMSNFPGQNFRFDKDNNKWTYSLPVPGTAIIPVFDVDDTGKFVKAAILHKDQTLGKRLLGATKYMTANELVERFKKAFPEAGKTASYQQLPEEVYKNILKGAGMPEFVAQELLENMLLLDSFGYYGKESLDWTHSLLEDKLTTWDEFVKKTPLWKDLK
ncbi:NmrA family transcriptional regulator [Podospora australis]|uniref:NmrA family transcriptional regulator n=1 Tax=Podospora australis TaxID=1536484 RepID=A0AAN7AG54_9PEZI|nr:NmrA family transcriptional regulator [Podospora australis]